MTVQIHAQVNVLPHLAVGIAQLRTPVDHPIRSEAFDEVRALMRDLAAGLA